MLNLNSRLLFIFKHNTPPCSCVGEISKEFCFEHESQAVRTLPGLCAREVMLVILKITPVLHADGAPNLATPTSQLMWSSWSLC